jgi:hypothetical protein
MKPLLLKKPVKCLEPKCPYQASRVIDLTGFSKKLKLYGLCATHADRTLAAAILVKVSNAYAKKKKVV